MPAGRDAATAERNAEIKAMRRGDLSYGRPLSPSFIASYFGIARQKVHKIITDPSSHLETRGAYRAEPVVDLLLDHDPNDGISHGSEAGYRKCRARPEGACVDCKDAHALTWQQYQERRKAREAAATRSARRRRA